MNNMVFRAGNSNMYEVQPFNHVLTDHKRKVNVHWLIEQSQFCSMNKAFKKQPVYMTV